MNCIRRVAEGQTVLLDGSAGIHAALFTLVPFFGTVFCGLDGACTIQGHGAGAFAVADHPAAVGKK
ncbi:MAG: hypothetical protein ACLUMK_12505 [Christensenellales bacterium]